MRKILLTLLATIAAGTALRAQGGVPEGYAFVDSLVFIPVTAVDTTLAGNSIFTVLPENVSVRQGGLVRNAVESRVRQNRGRLVNGYRIRIFFDNSQTARSGSEAALYRFKVQNPGVAAYRSFANPYFKVTVGDYRTKSEALEALASIKAQFPAAFIVKERFKYPAMDNVSAYRVDTLRILKPVR